LVTLPDGLDGTTGQQKKENQQPIQGLSDLEWMSLINGGRHRGEIQTADL
jgi:hypothetical protein